jgi:hypothetical protein
MNETEKVNATTIQQTLILIEPAHAHTTSHATVLVINKPRKIMSDAIQAKIAELETEMARTQKNKATNYHLGMQSKSPSK